MIYRKGFVLILFLIIGCSIFVLFDKKTISNQLKYRQEYLPIMESKSLQLYAPLNLTESNRPCFSFSASDNADSYLLEIFDVKSDICIRKVQTKYTYTRGSTMDELLPGEYYFTVTPFKEKLQIAPKSEKGFFAVADGQLASEIILGKALDSQFPIQVQPLILPECAVLGPDGAIYISNTFSHIILKAEDDTWRPLKNSYLGF